MIFLRKLRLTIRAFTQGMTGLIIPAHIQNTAVFADSISKPSCRTGFAFEVFLTLNQEEHTATNTSAIRIVQECRITVVGRGRRGVGVGWERKGLTDVGAFKAWVTGPICRFSQVARIEALHSVSGPTLRTSTGESRTIL